ncbi:ABC transporter permease [Halonatronum saccharophilum]|uniref:ABC transporter permease n=1 Tax=Halonatronum saccharophilum TaxID=150060 RepID=UPI0004BB7C23|nr:ABC transporter permease subunit [Halonatronum saccharophilum]
MDLINTIRYTIVYTIVALLILPLIILLMWSFSGSWPWPHLLPIEFTLDSWAYFFNPISGTGRALLTSLIIAIAVTVISIGVSIPASKALALYSFWGKDMIKLLLLAPIIVPPLAATMGIHMNFIKYGLSGQIIGVILVHLIPSLPYSIMILNHTFEGVGNKIEEQAAVLGANWWQTFVYITLPLIKRGIFSASIMVFIISFSQYFLTFLIGGGRVVTFTMLLFPLVERGNRSLAAVYSIVFIISILIFIVILESILKKDKIFKAGI